MRNGKARLDEGRLTPGAQALERIAGAALVLYPGEWLTILFCGAVIPLGVWRGYDAVGRAPLSFAGAFCLYVAILAVFALRLDDRFAFRVARRLATLGMLSLTYFNVRWIIRAAAFPTADALFDGIDRLAWGGPFALLTAGISSRPFVEAMSVWYEAYIPIIAAFMFIHVFTVRDNVHFARVGIAIPLTFVTGFTCYMLLPGYGPYHYSPELAAAPLQGGPVFDFVYRTYLLGPLTDIFPSLHTAHVVYFAVFIFAFRRRSRWYRWTAVPMAVAAACIVASTVVLRWHYTIDVAAGALLGVLAHIAADRLAPAWESMRERYAFRKNRW